MSCPLAYHVQCVEALANRTKTPSGGNFGILAFADHLHAQTNKTTGKRKRKKPNKASKSDVLLKTPFCI